MDEHQLCDVVIHQPLVLDTDDLRLVHFILDRESDSKASFEIYSRAEAGKEENWQLHTTGRIEQHANPVSPDAENLDEIKARCNFEVTEEEHYQQLQKRGFPFGPAMQGVKHVWRRNGEALVEIEAPAEIVDEMELFHFHPALLDACLQSFWTTFDQADGNTYLPMNLESFSILRPLPQKVWNHIRLRGADKENSDAIIGDVQIMDENNQIVGEIHGLYFRSASSQMFQARHEWDDWFYEVDWQLQSKPRDTPVAEPVLISTADLAGEIELQVLHLEEEHRIERYREMFPQIEKLSAGYIAAALRDLGLQFQVGQRISADALPSSLGIVERYGKLTYRLLDILVEAGYLRREENAWEVLQTPGPEMEAERLAMELQRLLDRYPESRGQLTLTGQCGEALSRVLHGKQDPLSLLFPDGSLELTELLYRESPQSRIFNNMVKGGIQKVLATLPEGKSLRILEIGAGTGGTTSYVLPILPSEQTEYFFTDISPLFLSRGKERFSEFNFVRYELLNVENDPKTQGFTDESFDIILAVNVLHATSDMAETLAHVKELMKPNGHLMLVEGTKPENWVDITFGLTDGWWRFTDAQLRTNYPLMPREKWEGLLAQTGFRNFEVLPTQEVRFQQALILAQPAFVAPGHWLILADEFGVGRALVEHLTELNQTCTVVTAGEKFKREDNRYTIHPSSPEDFKQLLNTIRNNSHGQLRGVVYLWSLDLKKTGWRVTRTESS